MGGHSRKARTELHEWGTRHPSSSWEYVVTDCDSAGGILRILAFVVLFLAVLFFCAVALLLFTIVLIVRDSRSSHFGDFKFQWLPVGAYAVSLLCLVRLEHFLEYGVHSKTVQYCVFGSTFAALTIVSSFLIAKAPRRVFLVGGVLTCVLWCIALKAAGLI